MVQAAHRQPTAIPPLLAMTPTRLDALYRASSAGDIPNGAGRGIAILAPGTPLARPLSQFVRLFAWQGKVFDRQRGDLRNSITLFRILAVHAQVYRGASLLDGGESIILDYSRTSWIARWVRDEIREVAPGVYLGYAYVFRIRVIAFAVIFPIAAGLVSSPTTAAR